MVGVLMGPPNGVVAPKAHVINQHNNDIRCALWRLDAEQWRCLDTANVELLELGRIRFSNRKVGAGLPRRPAYQLTYSTSRRTDQALRAALKSILIFILKVLK
jgi:hypothetical protein